MYQIGFQVPGPWRPACTHALLLLALNLLAKFEFS